MMGSKYVKKAREDAELLYLAQDLENGEDGESIGDMWKRDDVWKAPRQSIVKCNIGAGWSKRTKIAEAS